MVKDLRPCYASWPWPPRAVPLSLFWEFLPFPLGFLYLLLSLSTVPWLREYWTHAGLVMTGSLFLQRDALVFLYSRNDETSKTVSPQVQGMVGNGALAPESWD